MRRRARLHLTFRLLPLFLGRLPDNRGQRHLWRFTNRSRIGLRARLISPTNCSRIPLYPVSQGFLTSFDFVSCVRKVLAVPWRASLLTVASGRGNESGSFHSPDGARFRRNSPLDPPSACALSGGASRSISSPHFQSVLILPRLLCCEAKVLCVSLQRRMLD